MTVKIVTDSTADLPPQLAQELGITVVPVYVRFGDKVYRDGVDISQDELYRKLVESPIHLARLGPALGVHGGPGTLIVALREKVSSIRQEAGEVELKATQGKPSKRRISLPSLHIPKLRFSCP